MQCQIQIEECLNHAETKDGLTISLNELLYLFVRSVELINFRIAFAQNVDTTTDEGY